MLHTGHDRLHVDKYALRGRGGGGCHLDCTWTNRLFVVGGGKGCHLDCIWTNRLFVVKQVVSGTNRLFVGGEQGVSFRLHVDK